MDSEDLSNDRANQHKSAIVQDAVKSPISGAITISLDSESTLVISPSPVKIKNEPNPVQKEQPSSTLSFTAGHKNLLKEIQQLTQDLTAKDFENDISQ